MDTQHSIEEDNKVFGKLFYENSYLLFLVVGAYFGSYFLNLILANMLQPVDYGDISLVLSVFAFCTPFALMGTEVSVVHFLPKYLSDRDFAHAHGFLRWSFELVFALATFIFLISSFVVFLSMIIASKEVGFERWHIYVYSIWLIPIFSINIMFASLFQALKHSYLSTSFNGLGGIVITTLCALAMSIFWYSYSGEWFGRDQLRFTVILILATIFALTALIQYVIGRRFVPKEVWNSEPLMRRPEWMAMSYKMLISGLIFTALLSIDIVMIRLLSKNQADVGHFASIMVIAQAMYVFGGAVNLVVGPLVNEYASRNDKTHLQHVVSLMNIYKLVPGTLFFLVTIFFGSDLLALFGKGFPKAYEALVILGVGVFIGLLFNAAGTLMVYSKHQVLNFYLSVSQLLFIIIGDILIIPTYGLVGAAYVFTTALLLSSLARAYFVRKELGIRVFFFI